MLSGWQFAVTFNLIVALAYSLICAIIVRGLVHTRQLKSNKLAIATACIFATCAAGHGGHALHLLFDLDPATASIVRDAFNDWYGITIDGITAVVATVYLTMRRSYGRLLRTPAMFDSASEARYRQLAANLPHTAVYLFDRNLRIVIAEGEPISGVLVNSAALEGKLLPEVVAPHSRLELEPHWLAALDDVSADFDYLGDADGQTYRIRARPAYDEAEQVVGGVLFTENVTDERAVQAQLAEALNFNDAVLAASPDITAITDLLTGAVTWTSRSVLEMLGWTAVQLRETGIPDLESLTAEEDRSRVTAADDAILELPDGDSVTVRYRLRGGDAEYRWVSRRSTPFGRDSGGRVVQSLSVIREITDAMTAEQHLQHAALHDPLTGLPNRSLLVDRIAFAIARAERDDTEVGVLFCDLDGFKRINDTAGHAGGDAVLIEVADRLRQSLRKSDSIARVGGDEFVIILEPASSYRHVVPDPRKNGAVDSRNASAHHQPYHDPEHEKLSFRQIAEAVAGRIRGKLADPILYDGRTYEVSISIGMTFARRGSVADDVLRDADAAMYLAKQRGRDRFEIFDDELRKEVIARNVVERALRSALTGEGPREAELSVAYQPVFDLGSGRLVGFEALARLTDANGRFIPPDQFIPVAENTGLITPLGTRVLNMALAGLVRWRDAHPREPRATLAVNFSARQAHQSDLADMVLGALYRYGLSPKDLTLELTESILLETGSSGMRQLSEVRRAGVGIAIDDFGTGYASLSYLATLPISSLKVDKSFTNGLPTDSTSVTIVRAIAALAAELNLSCVVEGIETERQLAALPAGVLGQGYLLGRPTAQLEDTWSRVYASAEGPENREPGTLIVLDDPITATARVIADGVTDPIGNAIIADAVSADAVSDPSGTR